MRRAPLTPLLPSSLSAQVDLSDEESSFFTVASQCLSVLVLGLNTRLDGPLQEMARMRWDNIDAPGDDSVFVNGLRKVRRGGAAGQARPGQARGSKQAGRVWASQVQEAGKTRKCRKNTENAGKSGVHPPHPT